MSDANKAVVTKFLEALGRGDGAALSKLMTSDIQAVCTGTGLMAATRSHADGVGAPGMLRQMAPAGMNLAILELTAEQDRVSAEVEGHSTLVTGQPYNNQYHFLFYLRDEKIYRIKEYMDSLLVENLLGPFVRAAAGN